MADVRPYIFPLDFVYKCNIKASSLLISSKREKEITNEDAAVFQPFTAHIFSSICSYNVRDELTHV
ncbi:CLUMA_CG014864, isoform A [Clunio marinus]|uniref:CLUMA_CG014864, isoform A n=1 Tax=Clunio marinus TaxID=568069 RepID=A0A1J1IT10_9DIPT|nr:CLUMA_CG014864, isoform A [Clunio marinus]